MKAGQQIRGTYRGVAFAGVIKSASAHTTDQNVSRALVILNQPIVVYGSERDSLWLETETENFRTMSDVIEIDY